MKRKIFRGNHKKFINIFHIKLKIFHDILACQKTFQILRLEGFLLD